MPFTPIQTFAGGLLLHLSTSSLLSDTGRVFGISGIFNGALFESHERWQWAVLGGLVSGPLVGHTLGLNPLFPGDALTSLASIGLVRLAAAGVLVGIGSRLGSGCTSGHMLCGLSRLSPRSFVATGVFFTTAVITANMTDTDSLPPTPTSILEIPSIQIVARLFAIVGIAAIAYRSLRSYLISRPSASGLLKMTPYYLAALTFSLGLSLSGMTDPIKVTGFLRFLHPRHFDPSLAMVVLGGVLPNAIHYRMITRNRATQRTGFSWEKWRVPTRRDIDRSLVSGAGIFGVGWGLAGICPGPALVNLGAAFVERDMAVLMNVMAFTCAMMAGMYTADGYLMAR
ncbi:hypothetical protein IAR55_001204 [Kwoniella newhampshirensis]|uniref:Sulphur transport domain-containing protein n=1 Tax=Kwoniella newhampshirensis TaxID=1651941 RepID=A0AAW0Z4Z2_9TREE